MKIGNFPYTLIHTENCEKFHHTKKTFSKDPKQDAFLKQKIVRLFITREKTM